MLKYASLTCVFVSLFAGALSAQTVPVSSEVETSAVVGIAFGETAQFNVLNPGVQAPATGVICNATVSYIGGDGTVLKTSTVSVAPGKSAAVFLHSDTDLSLASGGRREIRAQISVPAIVPPTPPAMKVPASGQLSRCAAP